METIKCPKCNNSIAEETKICPYCGYSFEEKNLLETDNAKEESVSENEEKIGGGGTHRRSK